MSKQTAPHWCPNAIATARGWEDPVTGEVYVSDGSLDLSSPAPATESKSGTSNSTRKKEKLFKSTDSASA